MPADRPRLLVVDDDEVLARSYVRMLSADGYHVEVRLDGEAAVAAVEAGEFDVVLSDIDMPRLGGLRSSNESAPTTSIFPWC